MSDKRLLSVHLEAAPRRADFRKAREVVEGALGEHTVAGRIVGFDLDENQPTMAPGSRDGELCSLSGCWLLDRGKIIPLKIGLNTIGRMPDNDIVLDSATVSRRHCAIVVHSDLTCELHDVASKNGTLLNSHKITSPTRLKNRDQIHLCDRQLIFVFQAVKEQDHPLSSADDVTHNG